MTTLPKYALLVAVSLLATSAMAGGDAYAQARNENAVQQQGVADGGQQVLAPPTNYTVGTTAQQQNAGVTVDRGPLFLKNVVNKIKDSFKRDDVQTAPATLRAAPAQQTRSAATQANTRTMSAQAQQQKAALEASSRMMVQTSQQNIAGRQQENALIAQQQAEMSARAAAAAAGVQTNVGVSRPVVPAGTQVQVEYPNAGRANSDTPKPIFNNFR